MVLLPSLKTINYAQHDVIGGIARTDFCLPPGDGLLKSWSQRCEVSILRRHTQIRRYGIGDASDALIAQDCVGAAERTGIEPSRKAGVVKHRSCLADAATDIRSEERAVEKAIVAIEHYRV